MQILSEIGRFMKKKVFFLVMMSLCVESSFEDRFVCVLIVGNQKNRAFKMLAFLEDQISELQSRHCGPGGLLFMYSTYRIHKFW